MVGQVVLLSGLALLAAVWFLVLWVKVGSARVTAWAIYAIFWVVAVGTAVEAIGTPRESIITYTGEKAPYAEVVYQLSIGVVLVLALVSLLPTGIARNWRNGASLGFLVFAGASIAGSVFATNHSLPTMFVVTLIAGVSLCTAPGLDLDGLVRNLRRAVRVFTYGSLASIAVSYSWAFSVDAQIQDRHLFGLPQLFGLTSHPNTLGALAAFACVLEAANIARGKYYRWHLTVAIVVVTLSQSRTGVIAAALGLILLSGPASRILRWMSLALVGVIGAALFVVPGAIPGIENFLTNSDVSTLNGRARVWDLAFAEYARNPAFGYGPELFGTAYREQILGPEYAFVGQAHNQFVHTLAQGGVFLFIALIIFLVCLLIAALRGQTLSAGLTFALFVVLAERMITETPLLHRGADASWLLDLGTVAIIAVAARISIRESEPFKGEIASGTLVVMTREACGGK